MSRAAAVAGMLAIAVVGGTAVAHAQDTATDAAEISGSITLLTPDAMLGEVRVELIAFRSGEDPERVAELTTVDGNYRFEAEADPLIDYLVLAEYEGMQYLSDRILLAPELPTAVADFEVFETTDVAPALSIDQTTVTVLAIDREASELTLIREDVVRHTEQVIFTGGDDGVTLRLPVPDHTVDAGGLDGAGEEFALDGGTVAVTTPLWPGVTSVVTRYTVRYEADEDEYRLRITAPVPSEAMTIRVPQRFLREVRPEGDDAARADDADFEGEPLTVIERTSPAAPGQGLVADLIGLSGVERATHPLTSGVGAVIGAAVALVIVAGFAIGLRRVPGLSD